MHIASEGVATGDPSKPYVARVTIGTRNKRDVLAEFPMPSLKTADEAAEHWLNEYCARIGIGDDRIRLMSVMQPRWDALIDIPDCPKFPEPGEKYCKALLIQDAPPSDAPRKAPEAQTRRRKTQYPSAARVAKTVADARRAGLLVTGVRVWPDGSVAAFTAGLSADRPQTEMAEEI